MNALVMSHAVCANCRQVVGVHWLFRTVFFIASFVTAALTGLIVYVHQGLYAALLFLPLPIGAIGYIKARFSPLVVRSYEEPPGRPSAGGNLSRE